MSSTLQNIIELFRKHGDSEYGGESVTQLEHALQTAMLAELAGAASSLIAAALLHDIGHLLHELPDDAPGQGIDDLHEQAGWRFLHRYAPAAVSEPVRLHVAAKRYLCAVDTSYAARLSPPSVLSLQLQGGPMSATEVQDFQQNPWAGDAVRLRKWDDEAKVAGLQTPPLEHFIPALAESLQEKAS